MTLTEFLLERVVEDETRAKTHHLDSWHTVQCGYDQIEASVACECLAPVRLLAECEAKRQVVDLRTVLRRLCAPVEVERGTDRSLPAFGLLVGRHGLTLTFGYRVYRVRRLRHLPPAPLRLVPLVDHWPPPREPGPLSAFHRIRDIADGCRLYDDCL